MLYAPCPKGINQINAKATVIQICLQTQDHSTQWLLKGPLLLVSVPWQSLPTWPPFIVMAWRVTGHCRKWQPLHFWGYITRGSTASSLFLPYGSHGSLSWDAQAARGDLLPTANVHLPGKWMVTWKRTCHPSLGLPTTVALTDTLSVPQSVNYSFANISILHCI